MKAIEARRLLEEEAPMLAPIFKREPYVLARLVREVMAGKKPAEVISSFREEIGRQAIEYAKQERC